MIVSDHSPCTQDLKSNNFIDAWGGISSLQFGKNKLNNQFIELAFIII